MMAKALKTIDVSDNPEILRIAEEVRLTNEPRLLRREGQDLVVVMPATIAAKPRRKRAPTAADYEAFHAAAGGWKDVDTDRLIADAYADRRMSDRPPVRL